jgi:hypothetical protein
VLRGLPSPPFEGSAVEDAVGDFDPDGPFEAEKVGEDEIDDEMVAFVSLVVIAGTRVDELTLEVPVIEEDVVNEEPPDDEVDPKPKPIRFLSKSKTV